MNRRRVKSAGATFGPSVERGRRMSKWGERTNAVLVQAVREGEAGQPPPAALQGGLEPPVMVVQAGEKAFT